MTTHIIVTIVLGLLSINGISFLKSYGRLIKSGVRTNGQVVAFEASNFIMTKNATIPKIKFQAEEQGSITGKPIHSWFIELNNYQLNKNYVTIYDHNEPKKFIVKSSLELLTNLTLVTAALVSFIWLVVNLV